MANTEGAFGLRPIRTLSGGSWSGSIVKCYVSSNYATALYVGDPVLITPTLTHKDPTGMHPTVIKSAGTAGTIIRGVVVGVEPNPNDLTKVYRPASTSGYVYVCLGGDVVYEVKGDGGGALTSVVPGQNAVLIATTAGSTVTGLSGMNLDEGTTTAPNTTQDFTLHILAVKNAPDNELGADAVYEVLLNTCENATGRFLGITAS